MAAPGHHGVGHRGFSVTEKARAVTLTVAIGAIDELEGNRVHTVVYLLGEICALDYA